MSIPFLKVQGAGNDFLLIDALGENSHLNAIDWSSLAPRICDRHLGVGADGILIARDSKTAAARMEIVNADGSDGEMCGNGIRCFARYLIERAGFTPDADVLPIETGAGVLNVSVSDYNGGEVNTVTVDMGPPRLEPDQIPMRREGPGPVLQHPIELPIGTIDFTCVSMGNPHAVWFLNESQDIDEFPLDEYGPLVETHPDFPNKTNVEIVQVLSRTHLKMRVWERGVGLTMACGTGACAVLVAAQLRRLVEPTSVTVSMPGGDVEIAWQGLDNPDDAVFMTGGAEFSFEGRLGDNLLGIC